MICIVLCEVDIDVEIVKVDVCKYVVEGGCDYYDVIEFGYVLLFEFDDGMMLCEGLVIV